MDFNRPDIKMLELNIINSNNSKTCSMFTEILICKTNQFINHNIYAFRKKMCLKEENKCQIKTAKLFNNIQSWC